MRIAVLMLAGVLVAIRLPSLAQPMGADQGLYAYVGERILDGGLPYVDAWDQKPPAIHYTYALMRLIWPSDAVVPAADLAAAVAVAALLFAAGRALASRAVGTSAALVFLCLSNPAFTRLNGVRARAQCETFIALAIAAAVWVLARHGSSRVRAYGAAGALFGLAVAFKYNAAVYALAAAAVLLIAGRLSIARTAALAGGAAIPIAVFAALLAGAYVPLYDATITYNVQYSGETYAGPLHFARYLLTFPIERARTDALWTVGGAGCLGLLATGLHARARLVPVAWVAAACLSMAINGSRGLPQYYVQVAPALALAAGWAACLLCAAISRRLSPPRARAALATLAAIASIAVWRVNQFPKLLEQTWYDASYLAGGTGRDAYLARYADDRKYSAIGAVELARLMAEHSSRDATVYLFGFTPAAYVYADRTSASRFFWSRPVIAGFKDGAPGYGAAGLLADLERSRPSVVALQQSDWAPDVDDSAHFFLSTPPLAGWLHTHYRPIAAPAGFDVWIRRD